uniref:ATP synthase F0 subunit 8 n=1 Tax=Ditylenchus dipsaci TaxID=166011 RepID=A0A915CZK2_9BILA
MSVVFVILGFLFYCYYLLKTRGKTFTSVTSQMDPDQAKLCSPEKDGLLSSSVLPSAPLLTPVLSTRTKQKVVCSAQG